MLTRGFEALQQLCSRLRPISKVDLREPPRTVTDETGREIRLRADQEGATDALVGMYADFDPSQRSQGTPPLGEPAIRDWLADVSEGVSVVAFHGDTAVGHVLFVPDDVGRHELAIFVHQDYQRAGIGTALLRTGLGHAREQGVTNVWLTVEPWKGGAQKLYSDAGFTLDNPLGPTYRMSRHL
jgi:ribosomal protein S18 acetylase RimI-like enzyme